MKSSIIGKSLITLCLFYLGGCEAPSILQSSHLSPIIQIPLDRVETMPNHPVPYQLEDWRQKALDFDAYIFDTIGLDGRKPFMWMDNAQRNFPQRTLGLYTAVNDVRQGPLVNNAEAHEAICVLGAINGASLVGIDKSHQHGLNYVKMIRNYFNSDSGWNIIMNFTNKSAHVGGGYGNDFWYDVFNNVLFYAVADHYPETEGFDKMLRKIAEQFLRADEIMGRSYSHSFFDFKKMQPGTNHIPPQEDVAGGFAFILYAAYVRFGEERYLNGAKHALEVLLGQKENRFWEILMPFAAYVGARLNAEENAQLDIQTFLDWTFDGDATNREGWGVINERWGDYDVHGLVGSTIDRGGYGFLMNTFDLAWPLVPLVRYDQRFARAIAKWLLNASNAARLCYPYNLPDSLQILPEYKELTRNLIGYEGLIHHSIYPGFGNKTPVAQGDGPLWAQGNPPESMFSIYGSGHVGVFGSIIKPTNVDQILQLDCTVTDMYQKGPSYPTFLYFNPYDTVKNINVDVGYTPVDIYDTISHRMLKSGVSGEVKIDLASDGVMVLVIVPSGAELHSRAKHLLANDVVIDFRFMVDE